MGIMGIIEALVSRAVVKRTEERGLRLVQAADQAALPDTEGLEHFEPYGITARPLEGAEALLLNIGGDIHLPVVLVTADRRHRPQDQAEGDVTLYNAQGTRVDLAGAKVHLAGKSGPAVARVGDEVTITIKAGDLGLDGSGTAIPTELVELTGKITVGSSKVFAE